MFSLYQLETRKVVVSSLISCIYLPVIVTAISFQGLLYTVGKSSSIYILGLIFSSELLKGFYLNSFKDEALARRQKHSKSGATELLKSLLFIVSAFLSFFIAIILFGAPAMENHEETLMLSALLTLLTVFPIICYLWVEMSIQLVFGVKAYKKDSVIEMLVNNAVLTLCGAWLGAIVIPLDWNRPWQLWPIPCYLGAIGGYLLSNVLTVLRIALKSASKNYPIMDVVVKMLDKLRVN